MEVLTALDKKLLFALDTNARQSISDLARGTRYGRDIVAYRVHRLFEQQIIRGTSAVIDPARLGYTVYKTYLRLRNKRTRVPQLLSALQAHPAVFCYAIADGHCDVIFNMVAHSPAEFELYRDEVIAPIRADVLEIDFAVVLEQHLFPKRFIAPQLNHAGWTVAAGNKISSKEESSLNQLQDRDLKILLLLSRDARIPTTDIAERLSITPIMARTSIERLESLGIIAGYRIDIDRKKLGLGAYKAQFSFAPGARDLLKKLRAIVAKEPAFLSFIHQLGTFRVECNAMTPDFDGFRERLDRIAIEYEDLVENVAILIINDERFNWTAKVTSALHQKSPVPEQQGSI